MGVPPRILALRAVGVDLISVLGAAGVAGIAIGFAAQTVLSNLISGIFIMSERSIRLGDYITTDSISGTVESVNLLSVTLRQVDNATVRIPCESLVKSPVINITGDALRRCDDHLAACVGDLLHQLGVLMFLGSIAIVLVVFGSEPCVGVLLRSVLAMVVLR